MKRAIAIALFVHALALAACSRFPLACGVDPAFPVVAVEKLREGAKRWNANTIAESKITLEGGEWYVSRRVNPKARGFAGYTDSSEQRIDIRPDIPVDDILAVGMHEFGHALGLCHLCDGGTRGCVVPGASACVEGVSLGVMDPLLAATVFSRRDIAECIRVGECTE